MSTAFTFPGQGSQKTGMGKDLADQYEVAKRVFQEVDDAVGKKLSSIMWEGSADELTLTENAQPALMAVSMAVMQVLEQEKGLDLASQIKYVAGHSLGEYSALAAAKAIRPERYRKTSADPWSGHAAGRSRRRRRYGRTSWPRI